MQQEKSRGAYQLQHTAARIRKDLWCTTTQKCQTKSCHFAPKKRRVWEEVRIILLLLLLLLLLLHTTTTYYYNYYNYYSYYNYYNYYNYY